MQVMFFNVSTPWTKAHKSRLFTSRSSFSNRWSLSATSEFVLARSLSTSRSISCSCSSIGSSLFWYSFLAFSKFSRITSVNASSPCATTSHRSPERNHISQPQGVSPIHEQLEHDLQRRAFPLQSAGNRDECLNQRRAERVDHLEHRPVGFPCQQHFQDLGPHLGRLLERLFQLRAARIVLRLQHTLLCNQWEVAVFQRDRVEAALPMAQDVGKIELLDARHVVADQIAQITLPSHEADDRYRSFGLAGLDQLGKLVPLGLHEAQIRRSGSPARESVRRGKESARRNRATWRGH